MTLDNHFIREKILSKEVCTKHVGSVEKLLYAIPMSCTYLSRLVFALSYTHCIITLSI